MKLKKLGPYRLDKVLGRGGMGTVYAGTDTVTGNRAAIKALAPQFADEEHFRGRFQSEIEAMKMLQHPNIVEIIGYGEDNGILYYSMELVEGKSLFDELKAGRRFHWREVAQIGMHICASLRHAHDRGIIHRDLKPGNLLLEKTGRVKLADFGIARLFDANHLTRAGGMLGTPDYMSPEQAQGKSATIRSDMYSLGSVLYALLARRPPFQSKSLADTINNLSYEKPPPVRDLAPDTPDEFADIVDRLLEKEPERRIGTAQALAKRLNAILTDGKTKEVVVPPAEEEAESFIISDDPDQTAIPDTVDSGNATAPLSSMDPRQSAPRAAGTAISPTMAPTKRDSDHVKQRAPKKPSKDETHFKEVDEEERRRADRFVQSEIQHGPVWPYAVALTVLLLVGAAGVIYSFAPKSAPSMFSGIQTVAERDVDDLPKIEHELKQFLELYADHPRAEDVQRYLSYVERTKYARRLKQRLRLQGTDSLECYERDFLSALRIAETSPTEAADKFQMILEIYGNSQDQPGQLSACIEAARYELEQLQPIIEQDATARLAHLKDALEAAKALQEESPQKAIEKLNYIIEGCRVISDSEELKREAETLLSEAKANLAQF